MQRTTKRPPRNLACLLTSSSSQIIQQKSIVIAHSLLISLEGKAESFVGNPSLGLLSKTNSGATKKVPKMTKRVPYLQGQVLEKAHPRLSFPRAFFRGNLFQESSWAR